jgi:hypothetical protein
MRAGSTLVSMPGNCPSPLTKRPTLSTCNPPVGQVHDLPSPPCREAVRGELFSSDPPHKETL